MKTRLTFVKLRNMPLYPSEEALVRVLNQSMAAFGKVKNVSIYKNVVGNGKFQCYGGEGFILLDTTNANETTYQELKPFIYIPEWQTTIQARWDNAPPACNYCKQSGHLIKDCNVKLNSAMGLRTCYRCKQAGHDSKDCANINTHSNQPSSQSMTTQETVPTPEFESQLFNTESETPSDLLIRDDGPLLTQSQPTASEKNVPKKNQKNKSYNKPNGTIADYAEAKTDDEDGDYEPTDEDMNTDSDEASSEVDKADNHISDSEADDIELIKIMNYPKSTSSLDSIHAQAQRSFRYQTSSRSTTSTQSTNPSTETTMSTQHMIPESVTDSEDTTMDIL
ncbi:hypothetical protein K450DRAFT_302781 [Umbelopsis ramanniana AG]|uniref:CCHC-type domain-containing protein n=1 Tax=Umbelopsis ramanniana AG TaxID=1314678 RepID=A0AAD5E3V4_UMBRA|nr:uncharacterized protein K450DRAFT_302781 [Umbelopsis ramanniana AG]KAI8576322.1 hypothetical protein K450DRAFT_302781 [Umbelopsis ramanniana AG]